jgi:hypothetical protein
VHTDDDDRACVWDAARLLLDAAGLRTYLFRVEVGADEVTIDVEHPRGGAWQQASLCAPRELLLASLDDPRRRADLVRSIAAPLFRRARGAKRRGATRAPLPASPGGRSFNKTAA